MATGPRLLLMASLLGSGAACTRAAPPVDQSQSGAAQPVVAPAAPVTTPEPVTPKKYTSESGDDEFDSTDETADEKADEKATTGGTGKKTTTGETATGGTEEPTTGEGATGEADDTTTGESTTGGTGAATTTTTTGGTTTTGAATGGTGGATDPADTSSAAHWFSPSMFFNQTIENAPKDSQSDTIIGNLSSAGWGTGLFRIDFSIDVFYSNAPTTYAATQFDDVASNLPDSDTPATVAIPQTGAAGFESSDGRDCDGGDCHYLAVDVTRKVLTEVFQASVFGGKLVIPAGASLAAWDFTKSYPVNLRGDVCTSADAGGFPIAPMLFTAEEVAAGEINHAIRFIIPNNRIQCRQYVRPATHGTGPSSCAGWATDMGVPYGARLRLRANFPVNSLPNAGAKVVARALQKYGMILADGGNIALTAKSDASSTTKWAGLLATRDLDSILPSDFVMIEAGTRYDFTSFDCTRTP